MAATSSTITKIISIPDFESENKTHEPFLNDSNKFYLNIKTVAYLKTLKPIFGFNGVGDIVYYRTYSRMIGDKQEQWADTIIRVINGLFHIRKDHYIKNKLKWKEDYWQKFASKMAIDMFQMKYLPPGRGLWAMGTDFVSKSGSTALFNCAFISTKNLLTAVRWTMDMLMHGCGVGFDTVWKGGACAPDKDDTQEYIIPDSREGWCDSVYVLLNAYIKDKKGRINKFPKFDYSRIRVEGLRIKGFGGISSGPAPLEKLHKRIIKYFDKYCEGKASETRVILDLINSIGACVIAGNVRRSAEIALGNVQDTEFMDIKNYDKNPERKKIGWASNNSVQLWKSADFDLLPNIIERCKIKGEPGILNMINIRKYARYGKESPDEAIGINPCGEIPLESAELCNLSELLPTRCVHDSIKYYDPAHKDYDPNITCVDLSTDSIIDMDEGDNKRDNRGDREERGDINNNKKDNNNGDNKDNKNIRGENNKGDKAPIKENADTHSKFDIKGFYKACKYATFYSSTVSLLPTHSPKSNKVIARNRRIGVSMSGITDLSENIKNTCLVRLFSSAYKRIKAYNIKLARQAGIPPSIRVTTVKPSGTISAMVGVSSGMHYPPFTHCIRRIRVSGISKIAKVLIDSKIPHEPDVNDKTTEVFEFPIKYNSKKKAEDVSVFEQFSLLSLLQRKYADNSVSCTITYNKETEVVDLEKALARFIPSIKSVSLLPHSDEGEYPQMPFEGITEEEYNKRAANFPRIDWSTFVGSDGTLDRYCTNESCELIRSSQ